MNTPAHSHIDSTRLQADGQMNYAGADDLQAIERCLTVYNADIVAKMLKGLIVLPDTRILDFGAGIGTLALEWQKRTGATPEGLEIDPVQIVTLLERGFPAYATIGEVPMNSYDIVYSSNVIEHIEDDVGALRELHARLVPGGTLVIYVPAMMALWSEMDRHVGHYRRYEKRELIEKIEAAGFKIKRATFVDSLGVFASLYLRFRGFKSGKGVASDAGLIFFDRVIYRASRIADALGLSRLWGKNLLVVATK